MYSMKHGVNWLLAAAVAAGLTMTRASALQVGQEPLLIRGGTLIDGSGGEPRPDIRILIEGDVIKDIWSTADRAGRQEPAQARIIDATGKFIVPGLIDSHVHYREYMGDLFLSHGVTTVVDLGNPYYWLKAMQEGLNTGRFHGPRMYFCGGPILSSSEEQELPTISRRGAAFGVMQRPADATQIIAATKAQSDCLKLSEAFPGELFTPLAQEARASGLAVISHSLQAVDSANWGITGIEHMVGIAIATIRDADGRKALAGMKTPAGHKNSFLYQWMEDKYFDEVIAHLVQRGVYINPTLAFEWKALSDRVASQEAEDVRLFHKPGLQYVPLDERLLTLGQYHWPDGRSAAEKAQFTKGYRKVQEFLRRFAKAGGKVYAGTDSAAATTPGLSLHHEMELLVDAGLSPMQALQAASKNGADLFGLGKVGTIAPGKWADVVILRDNPLADVRNTKSIETVIKAGKVVEPGYDSSHIAPVPHPGPISKHLYNPVPRLTDIVPAVATRSKPTTLRLSGSGFAATSVVRFGQHVLKATAISPTEVSVQLSADVIAQSGAYSFRVENPKPGGGESNAIPFIVLEGSQRSLDGLDQAGLYRHVPEDEFDALGWDLPDGGKRVKALADAAPGGAFAPAALEKVPAAALGYRAKWHTLRYPHYGLDWDITGLELVPNAPAPGLPTLAIIHGGSANWYEFFVDPLNNPGIGQYLAQKVRVVLITIPGNYKPGGWSEPIDKRTPAYLVDKSISPDQAKLRASVYTTQLVAEGVRRLLEKVTSGPLVVVGHSTGGEIPFLLQESSLKTRLGGVFLGWGSGGPARVLEERSTGGATSGNGEPPYPVWQLRIRTPEEYTNNYSYIGPLNPVKGSDRLAVARAWFAREERRRPQFKQVLQDAEHRPGRGSQDALIPQIRSMAEQALAPAETERVISDLFSTHRAGLTGFKKMLWIVARADTGHWNAEKPEEGLEIVFAKRFIQENPQAAIRVLVLDPPLSHYGHIERPRQLSEVLLSGLQWLTR